MKKWIKISILIISLVALTTGVFYVLRKRKPVGLLEPQKTPLEEKIEKKLPISEKIPGETLDVNSYLEIKKLASLFVERFGSYSNQAPFQNLIELRPFMTERMWEETSRTLKDKPQEEDQYRGFTTKVLSVKILQIQNKKAEVLAQTQRQEIVGTTDNIRVFYQEIEVEMVKEDGEWKVDGAEWKE